jgi:hypothetical protein
MVGIALVAVVAAVSTVAAPRGSAGEAQADESWASRSANGNLKGSSAEVGERLGFFDLVVVDGLEAKAAEVAAIRARGATVRPTDGAVGPPYT